jgi:hypothetical protein
MEYICSMYDLGIWTYVIALTHYAGELFIFRGCKLNGPFMSPLFVAGKVISFFLYGVIIFLTPSFISYLSYLAHSS